MKKQKKKNPYPNNDREADIQDEIRRRILEKEQALQEEKQRTLQTQATLEALEELTKIPVEEAQKIVRQVRAEYTFYHNVQITQKQAKWAAIHYGIVVVGIFLLGIAGVWYHNARRFAKISYTTVFSESLNSFNEPVKRFDRIHLP